MSGPTSILLNDGTRMPLLAFGAGTALLNRSGKVDRSIVETLKLAIQAGYRHVDTAQIYETETEVGIAIKESIEEGVVAGREELFVTTKISRDFLNPAAAIDESLKKLGLDYVDSYLIHAPYWPPDYTAAEDKLQAGWAAMEAVLASGKTRSIGVSNYDPEHLKMTLKTAKVPPTINQVEFHPYVTKRGAKNWLDALRAQADIAVSAYGALAPMTKNIPGPLDEKLKSIASKHSVSPGMVCLRWCIQQNVVAVTTSQKKERMEEYLRVFRINLTEDEMKEIGEAGMQCLKDREEPESRVVRYLRMKKEQEKSTKP